MPLVSFSGFIFGDSWLVTFSFIKCDFLLPSHPINSPQTRFIHRDNLWVTVFIILSGQLLLVLYYSVDMDIVLSSGIILGFYYSRDLFSYYSIEISLKRASFHEPQSAAFLNSEFEDFSPSAKIHLFPSSYVIIIIWNAIIYILHKLLANRTNFFAERGWEHHDLLAMGRAAEDFLNVFTHICNN